ncbi:MAG: cysteine synthase A [Candidatus Melainabacteria bacterium 35_41]|jgi:cysteine synthase A|nr:MAG: cysteine synthase A [Candidatus Melainabacteria bacterium 35_41]CDE89451.1 cysteine synthase [Clostridium sp. CAG:729]
MHIAENMLELIGKTPLVKINRLNENGLAVVAAKIESRNPAGSIKDRPALNMIEDAEKRGLLTDGAVIIEPTSGNTGIGLAMVCAIKGYKMILTMPETMSIERRKLLKAYGAELVLTEGSRGMQGAVDKAMELREQIPDSFIPMQFNNPANPEIHELTTAEEIWTDTDGKVDIVIAGVGTGGTISGIGKRLKEKNPDIQIVAVEPFRSQVLAGKPAGSHAIQGIGANFVPRNFNRDVVDVIYPVGDIDAVETARKMATDEGILCGISSGAAMFAALEFSKMPDNEGKLIVTILPDSGERYLSSVLFD